MTRRRSAAWLAMSPEMRLEAITRHAATGAAWDDLARNMGISAATLKTCASVLGVSNRQERPRMRAAVLEAMRSGSPVTIATLRPLVGGTLVCMRHALDDLRGAGLIRSTVRKVEAGNPRTAWGQYQITPAGLAELARQAPRKVA